MPAVSLLKEPHTETIQARRDSIYEKYEMLDNPFDGLGEHLEEVMDTAKYKIVSE